MMTARNWTEYKNMAEDLDNRLNGFLDICREQYRLNIREHEKKAEAERKDHPDTQKKEYPFTFPEFIKRTAWQGIFYFYQEEFVRMTEQEMLFISDFLRDYSSDISSFTEYADKAEREYIKKDSSRTLQAATPDRAMTALIGDKDYSDVIERIKGEPDYILSKEIGERLFFRSEEGYYGENLLYLEITRFAASLGFQTFDTEIKKAIIENAVRLRERKYYSIEDEICPEWKAMEKYPGEVTPENEIFTERDFNYPTDFPLEINEVLLYFYQWSFDEGNPEKIGSLLAILRQYCSENLICVPEDFSSYFLKEMKESLLSGKSVKESLLWSSVSDLSNFDAGTIISEEGLCLYRYPYLLAHEFEPWGTKRNEAWDIKLEPYGNTVLNTLYQINESIHALFHIYSSNITQYESMIGDPQEHIYDQDCPAIEYEGDEELEGQGYGRMSVQRDVMLLQSSGRFSVQDEDVKEEARLLLARFMDYREKKIYTLYINSISASFRKCLFALIMGRDLLENLLSKEHPLLAMDLKPAEELYESLDENCRQIERSVYRRYGTDVKAVLKSIGYEGIKILGDQEAAINHAAGEYLEELKHVWQKETLLELQNNKAERLKELRRRIPCLSKEVLEATLQLYLTFLQDKAPDGNLMLFINEKYRVIWDRAQKRLDRMYQEKGKTRSRRTMEKFIRPLFTAEYLYQEFAEGSMAELLDYSSISLEYYASLEYFMNEIIYQPLRELFLTGKESSGYQEYMNQRTHDKLVRYAGSKCVYNTECMLGNFGFLFDNIDNAPGLLRYFAQFCGQENIEDATVLKDNIKTLAKKLVKYTDNISSRRNESAHGGKILDVDKAKAARAIIYDVNTDVRNVAAELKDSFRFLLNLLRLEEETLK